MLSMILLDQLLILQLSSVDHLLDLVLKVTIDVNDALAKLTILLLQLADPLVELLAKVAYVSLNDSGHLRDSTSPVFIITSAFDRRDNKEEHSLVILL